MKRMLFLLVCVGSAACSERLTAPGVCPTYCPEDAVTLIDSVYSDAVTRDSTFVGYVPAHRAGALQLVRGPAAGGGFEAVGVLRFFPFADSLLVSNDDTLRAPPAATDSFRLSLPVVRRRTDQTGLQVAIHRLPATVDSTVDAGIAAFFHDSTLLAVVGLPDTLTNGAVDAVLPAAAFPTLAADGRIAAVGVRLISPAPAFLDVSPIDAGLGATLTRFVQIDSAGTTVPRSDARTTTMDTYVPVGAPPAPPNGLRVGGVPSARAFFRLTLPSAVIDSSTIVRATLLLVPEAPVTGAVGDTLQLLATGITADFGAKSPLIAVANDSIPFRVTRVAVGGSDTIRLDVTDVLRRWNTDPDLPRTIVVRAVPEGGSVAAVAVGGTTSTSARVPTIRVTHIPPVGLGRP